MDPLIKNLQKEALAIRRHFLKMHYEAKAGHIGTGLSSIDLLTYFYKKWLRPQDQFILSKGHGASALYATLYHCGRISGEIFQTYYQNNTLLPAHPAARSFAEIPVATGSLGHGFSVACGLAYSHRYFLKTDSRFACLLSDGECNEGSVWEAALCASHHRLSNLVVIIDANGLQGFGRSNEILSLEPFAAKWQSFGFEVHEIDGHDFEAMHVILKQSQQYESPPLCILARTIKGKGVSFAENKMEWHYLPMNSDQYFQALKELGILEKKIDAQ